MKVRSEYGSHCLLTMADTSWNLFKISLSNWYPLTRARSSFLRKQESSDSPPKKSNDARSQLSLG